MVEYMIILNVIFSYPEQINMLKEATTNQLPLKARPNTVVTLSAVTKKG